MAIDKHLIICAFVQLLITSNHGNWRNKGQVSKQTTSSIWCGMYLIREACVSTYGAV